jgi:hypothetical protein
MTPISLLVVALATTSTITMQDICAVNHDIDVSCFDRGDCSVLELELAATAVCYRHRARKVERLLAAVEYDECPKTLATVIPIQAQAEVETRFGVLEVAAGLLVAGAIGTFVGLFVGQQMR